MDLQFAYFVICEINKSATWSLNFIAFFFRDNCWLMVYFARVEWTYELCSILVHSLNDFTVQETITSRFMGPTIDLWRYNSRKCAEHRSRWS